MLVLTRKKQQSVTINEEIKVVILEVVGNTVKIGIQAPNGVNIVRTEILELRQSAG